MKLNLPPKLVGKTSLGPSYYSFYKVCFPVKHLMPYDAETGCSRPLTFRITLLYAHFLRFLDLDVVQ
jgi:hypothetical protein